MTGERLEDSSSCITDIPSAGAQANHNKPPSHLLCEDMHVHLLGECRNAANTTAIGKCPFTNSTFCEL